MEPYPIGDWVFNSVLTAEVMAQAGVDALVVTNPSNFYYVSGYDRVSFPSSSPFAAIVSGSPAVVSALILPRIEAPNLIESQSQWDEVLVLFGQFEFFAAGALGQRDARILQLVDESQSAPNFAEGFSVALDRVGLTGAKLGWDDLNVAANLGCAVDGVRQLDMRLAWPGIRRVKTASEIQALSTSAAISESVEQALLERCEPGVEWDELRHLYEVATTEAGGTPGFWSSGAGSNASVIVGSSPGVLRAGDLIRFDFGCSYRHYWSDTGRTVSLGTPDSLVTTRYQAIRNGIEAGWEAVRPGITPAQLFDIIISVIHRSGFTSYDRHHVGHSIGIEMYDADLVAPGHDTPLVENMVLNLEVPYYELGWGGMQIEDTAVVTTDGHTLLTHLDRNLNIVDS